MTPYTVLPAPDNVLILGDLHGNWRFAGALFDRLPELLPDESPRLVLQVGDFGIWDGKEGARYLSRMAQSLGANNAHLAFIDGNHEDFRLLRFLAGRRMDQFVNPPVAGTRYINDRIWYIPRGHRWIWHGHTWLGLGGAVSVDRALRTQDVDWWPDEEIPVLQAEGFVKQAEFGTLRADVMLTHDCPLGAPHPPFPAPYPLWNAQDLRRSATHQRRLRTVVDAVKPLHLIHGHLHMAYQGELELEPGRTVQVTGLAEEHRPGSWGVFNTRELAWQEPPE